MARATSDFTVPLLIGLALDAAMAIVLSARASVGSPPAVEFAGWEVPPREQRECGDGSVELLLDEARDEPNEYEQGREIAARIDHCGRWWFDLAGSYSLCARPRYDRLVTQLLELYPETRSRYEDPQLARLPGWRPGDSAEAHVLTELLAQCGAYVVDR